MEYKIEIRYFIEINSEEIEEFEDIAKKGGLTIEEFFSVAFRNAIDFEKKKKRRNDE